jgi:hypothetical protein
VSPPPPSAVRPHGRRYLERRLRPRRTPWPQHRRRGAPGPSANRPSRVALGGRAPAPGRGVGDAVQRRPPAAVGPAVEQVARVHDNRAGHVGHGAPTRLTAGGVRRQLNLQPAGSVVWANERPARPAHPLNTGRRRGRGLCRQSLLSEAMRRSARGKMISAKTSNSKPASMPGRSRRGAQRGEVDMLAIAQARRTRRGRRRLGRRARVVGHPQCAVRFFHTLVEKPAWQSE